MRIALFADIHSNLEAFEACLADAATQGIDRTVLLGDLVGYGGDPVAVVERARQLVAAGAIAVRGNHDQAAFDDQLQMSADAMAAISWTRAQLSDEHLVFLSGLPMQIEEDDRLYVHASAAAPADWLYVTNKSRAEQCLRATGKRYTFVGHTHFPAVFNATPQSPPSHHVPTPGRPIPLQPHRRWLAVLGAVGQPRDQNPDACYGILDTERQTLTYVRVPYDVDITARKIRAAGLPPFLADRLSIGM